MMTTRLMILLTAAGTLTAIGAAARAGDPPLSRADAIAACVELKEKHVACKDEWASYWATLAPPGTTPEQRERYRQKALQEIVAEGTGPLPPRQDKCASDVDRKKTWAMLTEETLAAARACTQQKTCAEQVACGVDVMKRAKDHAGR